MQVCVRSRLILVMACLLGAAGSAAAQAITITARTPSRGSTSGGTTVEVLGNGWFSSFATTVTMSGAGAAVTNLVIHSPSRLTFVTPARPAGVATITVTSTAGSQSRSFTYVAPLARSLAAARRPVFSYTGRYVAFESRYALVPGDTNGVTDIYVRDRSDGSVRRVSVSSGGAQAIGGESTHPAISGNGRFVAFQSRAANLVPGDTNGLLDVFLHDRDADGDGVFDEYGAAGAVSTVRVSMSSPGRTTPPGQAIGGDSGDPAISGDGRFVTFHSAATNLVPGDTNGVLDVFVHDRLTRATRLASTNANAVLGDGHSRNPAISRTGRFVVFESLANNLAGGNPTRFDIFLHDRDVDDDGVFDESGAIDTQLVSANRCEATLTNHALYPSITHDGRYVVYATFASNADVDANCLPTIDTNGASDIFIYDRVIGNTIRRLSVGPNGQFPADSSSPFISGNGQLLVFATEDQNAAGGGPVTGMGVFAAQNDGKSTSGSIPSPTNDTPPPADVDPPAPTQSTEDPTASGDGSNTANTAQPTPGTGGGEPTVEIEEVPPDANGSPFIAQLSPSSGPAGGGNAVDIQGSQFIVGSSVTWNGATVASQRISDSLMRVPNAPNFVAGSTVEVRVISDGEASNPVTYTYVAGLTAPDITTVNPVSGSVAGGTVVTITGTGFSNPTVRFGSLTATVNSANATTITATTPSAAVAGPVPVIVENGDGATAVSDGPFTYTFAPVVSQPTLASLDPNNGPEAGGTAITISGTQFGPGATVTVGGNPATDVQVLSNSQIVAVTPPGAQGPADVIVTVPGVSTPSVAQVFTYNPLSAPVLTCTGTDTDGDTMPDAWELQYGLAPGDATDAALDPDADGRTNAQECVDLTHPRGHYTRYLAEGATGSFFTTRVVVANPNAAPAHVLFRFLTHSGAIVRRYQTIPSNARRTIDLQLLAGLESANVSTVVESDTEIVVDRTMRWDLASRFGSHAEASVPAPSLQWYLAEGATHGFFDLFYLIQNPSLTTTAEVRITFLLPSGAPIVRTYDVPANTRYTLQVDAIPGLASTDVSGVLESTNGVPIIVERAMYSSAAGTFAAGHNSAGVTAPAIQWFFAEGATGNFFDLYLLFANPNSSAAAQVQARYLLPSGATVTRNYTINPDSRRTVYVAAEDPALADTAVSVSISVTNGVPIIAERAMWWPHGQAWFESHNSAGSTLTGTKWAVGDGEVGTAPDQAATFILVANTAATAATVRVTLLLETGAPQAREFAVAATSRFNVDVAAQFGLPAGTRFSAVVESLGAVPAPIVVERAMYWNANGVLWAAGSNLLATRLQ